MTIQATTEQTDPTRPTPIGSPDEEKRILLHRFPARPNGDRVEISQCSAIFEIVKLRADKPPVVIKLWRSEIERIGYMIPDFLSSSREAIVARPIRRGVPRGTVTPQPKAVRR